MNGQVSRAIRSTSVSQSHARSIRKDRLQDRRQRSWAGKPTTSPRARAARKLREQAVD
jgi:hypothetical protein